MRILLSFGALLLVAIDATGQRRGPPGNGPPAIGRPGIPVQPMYPHPPAPPGTRPGADGAGRDRFLHRGFVGGGNPAPAPIIVPYPVYVGAPDGPDIPQTDAGYLNEMAPPDPAPIPTITAPPPPPPPPPPVTREASPPGCSEKPPADSGLDDIRFLIALKDGWVLFTVAFWVEDGTLHYISESGTHNQVSLELVDRQRSIKLNASTTNGRGFGLPRR